MTTVKKGRMEFMDFLRGIAALAVVTEHGADLLFPSFRAFSHESFNLGKFGVTVFFLVSGFIIPLSLEKGKSIERFWIHRFFRLFPLYWFSLIATVFFYKAGWVNIVNGGFPLHLWRNAVVNLSMLQGLVGVPSAISLYYTLTIEMVFYVTCSLLLLTKKLQNSFSISCGLLSVLSILWIVGPLVAHRRVEMAGLFYGLTLFVGTTIYRCYQGKVSKLQLSCLLFSILCSTTGGIYLNYVFLKKANLREDFSFLAVFAPWLLAYGLFLCSYALRDFKFPTPATWLGRISYSVYLLHPIVIIVMYRGWGSIYTLGVMIAAVLFIANVSYLLIEKPMIAYGHRIGEWSSGATTLTVRVQTSS